MRRGLSVGARLAGDRGQGPLLQFGQLLAELHAPLVERIDAPDDALLRPETFGQPD